MHHDAVSSMTAISVLSCMKAAGLALLLSWGFCIRSSVNCKLIEATILQLSRRLPHSIFFCALDALTVDDCGARAGFSVGQLTTLYIEGVMDANRACRPKPPSQNSRAPCCAAHGPS